ncbi:hypothetical protein [Streptomyces sp. NPDC094032]|uniref:hypothetical protein n=1 Tax=Streptomyces sp. NPDC094032 TaxID=3155308 RepID=UPI0033218BE4
MRTSLRTSVVVAALAGAVLAPAASASASAFAAAPGATPAPSGATLPLADGGHAELFKLGPASYRAVLHDPRGKVTGELKADGAGRGDQFGGLWVTLTSGGALSSWENPGFGGDWSDTREGCTVTRFSGSPWKDVDLALSNGPKGPVARLTRSGDGKVLATLDRNHTTALYGGARVKGLLDPAPELPTLQMRVHGQSLPWEGRKFPAAPKNCGTTPKKPTPAPKPTPTSKPKPKPTTGTTTSAKATTTTTATTPTTYSQTSVVPKGSVAAGAELTAGGSPDRTLLFAGGGALAAAGAAGVALALFRRHGA